MINRDGQWDKNGIIQNMLDEIRVPRMVKVKQLFDKEKIDDIPKKLKMELSRNEISKKIKNNSSIAITCGSRGIKDISVIIKEIVKNVKLFGGNPFIIPAMGSHGGANAEGQKKILEELGVTEKNVGAPIISEMSTKLIGYTEDNKPVYIDKNAAEADGIIAVGRVKPHTAFRGTFESGIYKMLSIGLGKHKGATECHKDGFGNMADNIVKFADVIIKNTNIIFGVAIVENAYGETSIIEALTEKEIKNREPELLIQAKKMMPKILFQNFDILIVDKIGKNFSGDGMDPNITGTYCTPFAYGGPKIQRYVLLDLSEETNGNALGVGMADFTTKRLFNKADFDQGYINALTSTVIKTVKIPMVLENDKKAIQAAIFTCVGIDKTKPKIVRIKNSSNLVYIWISESLCAEAKKKKNIVLIEDLKEIQFDKKDNIF
jgi:hypothetical protein